MNHSLTQPVTVLSKVYAVVIVTFHNKVTPCYHYKFIDYSCFYITLPCSVKIIIVIYRKLSHLPVIYREVLS